MSDSNSTGYKNVSREARTNGYRFRATAMSKSHRHLGMFPTAVQAAVAVAKGLEEADDGSGRDENQEFENNNDDDAEDGDPSSLACDRPTQAGGYQLILSKSNPTGYKGVYQMANGEFEVNSQPPASSRERRAQLGRFSTAVEAAVAYAKWHLQQQQEEEEAEDSAGEDKSEREEDLVSQGLCGLNGCVLKNRHSGDCRMHFIPRGVKRHGRPPVAADHKRVARFKSDEEAAGKAAVEAPLRQQASLTLTEQVEYLKTQLGLSGLVHEVVKEAARQLGVATEGKQILELAGDCMQALGS